MKTDGSIDIDEIRDKEVAEVELPKASKGPDFAKLKKLTEVSPYIKKVLGELDVQNLDIKSRLEKLGDMFVTELRPLEVEGKALTAEEREYKKILDEFKTSIERLYVEETGKELMITKELIKRADREYNLGKDINRLERGENLAHSEAAAGVLERQNWGKLLTKLEEGDKVLSWVVPGADFLSIKYLNDKVFGPQITNKIIEKKRRVIEEEMEKKFHANVELIQNDYKVEVFRVLKSAEGPQVTEAELEVVANDVDEILTPFVSKLAGDLIKQERDALEPLIIKRDEDDFADKEEKIQNDKEIQKHEDRISVLDQFDNDLHGRSENNKGKKGFRMNFGLSEEIKGAKPKDKLSGFTQSLQTSRMAREDHDGYGAEYDKENILTELGRIKELREEIIGSGNTITDKDGNEFEIFIEEKEKFALNKDVLRDVRKGKFQTQDGVKLQAVSLYIKKLNLLDAVKPFVFADVETAAKSAERKKALAKKIKMGESLNTKEKRDVVEMLRAEEKDSAYTSKSEFSKRAVDMEDCAYVSLDVLDLGVDLLLEYESILQDIDGVEDNKKMEKFNEAALEAGDKTTEKLVEFRRKVASVCKEKEFGIGDGLITGEVGGDELTLAIDTSKIDEETLDKFLFRLKKETNSRVIKTVVAKSEKSIFSDTTHEKKMEAHLQALKRAEIGAAIAKDIEDVERKLNRLLVQQGELAVKEKIGALRGLFVMENGEIKSSVVVVEKEGVFKIGKFKIVNDTKNNGYESMGYEFDYESIRGEINGILGKENESK